MNLGNALLSVTALNPVLGYDKVARITRTAVECDIAPREAAEALGYLDGKAYDRLVDPLRMAKGSHAE